MTPAIPIARFLATLYSGAPRGSLVEVRYRCELGMRRAFFATDRLDAVATMIAQRAAHTDVYIGIIPRRRRGGGRDDLVDRASVVWVDCDTPLAVTRLGEFSPRPTITIQSGTDQHLHGYWLLSQAEALATIEHANRRLAHAIGADMACTDGARIMRPASSLNWKHTPPTSVRQLDFRPRLSYVLADVVGGLAEPPGIAARARAMPRTHADDRSDPLLTVEPPAYVERLTGARVPRSGKIACPFHNDRTPSLHVYPEPGRGWYCFGCGRGGSVYDFGAQLWDLPARGDDFLVLRTRLVDLLIAPSRAGKARS